MKDFLYLKFHISLNVSKEIDQIACNSKKPKKSIEIQLYDFLRETQVVSLLINGTSHKVRMYEQNCFNSTCILYKHDHVVCQVIFQQTHALIESYLYGYHFSL